MKSTFTVNVASPTFSAIVAIIMGVVMLVAPHLVISAIISIIGWGLILWGAIPLIISLVKKQPIPTVPTLMLCIGILVLVFAGMLVKLMVWIFGIILILAAVQQFNMLSAMKKDGYQVKFFNMIYPVLLLLVGMLTFLNPFGTEQAIVMLFGASMVFFGVTTLLAKGVLKRRIRQ